MRQRSRAATPLVCALSVRRMRGALAARESFARARLAVAVGRRRRRIVLSIQSFDGDYDACAYAASGQNRSGCALARNATRCCARCCE